MAKTYEQEVATIEKCIDEVISIRQLLRAKYFANKKRLQKKRPKRR